MMFGSIPQQDVFQRVTSAKSAKIALWGSVARRLALLLLHLRADVHRLFGDADRPGAVRRPWSKDNAELILPTLVLKHTPLVAQVLFFGAVLSAIMSTASATLLAPSVTFAENVIKGFFPHMGDHRSCG